MEGHIVGFDEYMNIVLDDAEEVYVKTNVRKQIGNDVFFYPQLVSFLNSVLF
jgi:small nuclear ribonucleoprotein (snRNP)-like protein